jgi:hypothetical protein
MTKKRREEVIILEFMINMQEKGIFLKDGDGYFVSTSLRLDEYMKEKQGLTESAERVESR